MIQGATQQCSNHTFIDALPSMSAINTVVPEFSLERLLPHEKQTFLFHLLKHPIEHTLGLRSLQHVYDGACAQSSKCNFTAAVLDMLSIRYSVPEYDLGRFPEHGPVIVVANHPFGGIEGIILLDILRSIRSDVKVMANYMLGTIPELRNDFILVDPFERKRSIATNIKPLRETLDWLNSGGVIGMFPAGEVSRFCPVQRRIADKEWSQMLGRLVRQTGASVVPVHFGGANGLLFQTLGLVHPRLQTLMLVRELLNKKGSTINVAIGKPLPSKRLVQFNSDKACAEYLRTRTYILANRIEQVERKKRLPKPTLQIAHCNCTIIKPIAPEELEREVGTLPSDQRLLESGKYTVWYARATQTPSVLREIGRLREITFREVGEGTGTELDLDQFDQHYLHLFIWDHQEKNIVGAYRLGRVDKITEWFGAKGLYTSTLFKYRPEFIRQLGCGLEVGRAFVRSEYQKSYAPLLLLWKGIGAYIAGNPEYRYLFGPISISNDYQTTSRYLMTEFLRSHSAMPDMAKYVQARSPFNIRQSLGEIPDTVMCDIDEIAWSVSDIENDSKGIPVLLRQYLKLGAKVLAFHVDAAFQNTVDGLMLVDLTKTDAKILGQYMGEHGATNFLTYHEVLSKEMPVELENQVELA